MMKWNIRSLLLTVYKTDVEVIAITISMFNIVKIRRALLSFIIFSGTKTKKALYLYP